jgi:putative SOS response-associated peptidase YedK
MCGRFALSAMLTDIAEEFSTAAQPNRTLPYDWNIKPTEDIYIIRSLADENNSSQPLRQIDVVSWGLIAPWSKSGDEAYRSQSQAINARSESVHEKPTFRNAFRSRRCLIPATGYYEWATALGEYPSKQPFYISRADSHLLSFAGIFDYWTSPEGVIRKSASIITQDATGELEKIHNRMPVILPPSRWDEWLNPTNQNIELIRQLMRVENPTEGIQFWPVKPLVNSIKNNGAELIEPIELGEPETLF